MGKQAKPLFGINWNNFWETPLEELRIDFNIDIPRNPISLRNQISEEENSNSDKLSPKAITP
jgi:hypothetical protein